MAAAPRPPSPMRTIISLLPAKAMSRVLKSRFGKSSRRRETSSRRDGTSYRHAADQMRAGGWPTSQRHGFFQALVEKNPVDRPARIRGGGVGGSPDRSRCQKESGRDYSGSRRRCPSNAACGLSRCRAPANNPKSVGSQDALPDRAAVGAAENFVMQLPPVNGGHDDGRGMLQINRNRAITQPSRSAPAGFSGETLPTNRPGIVFQSAPSVTFSARNIPR